jgi:antitoxin component of MazEF toxin-antitoxin module
VKLALRKIGNSVGVIIPKAVLDSWGLGEGDHLTVGKEGIHPPSVTASAHEALDELKRKLAAAVASSCTAQQIRAQSLANLHRWRSNGVWVSAYDEWKEILESGEDGRLFAVMLGRDESSTRLRQSAPYVGLLSRDELRKLNEEAAR